MTTNTDALTERLWDAIFQSRDTEDKRGEAPTESIVTAVLPIVEAEVRKAKAEALREAASARIPRDALASQTRGWLRTRAYQIEKETSHDPHT